ncbi:MAG: hypothetical protein M1836_004079 [Candelina mexicana]|nr:MAG: hypothetical protein M1836_004079 [Candelina mexicana]
MLSAQFPTHELASLVGPETFEFLGVGARSRFSGYRTIQTPLKATWGLCIANVLVLDRGANVVRQSSDLSTAREVEEAAYTIAADCLLHQNAGGKMIIAQGNNNDLAVFLYAVNSRFDRAENILNIDVYHPQDWEQLLDDFVLNTTVNRIRAQQVAGQGSSSSGSASTSTTQRCSTGYGRSSDDCCLDYSFGWKSIAAVTARLVLGTMSSLTNNKFGWCEFVTSTMESKLQSTKRDLSTTLSKRTISRPVCDSIFGKASPLACYDALADIDFMEDVSDADYVYEIARDQVFEFLAPYAQPRFPQYKTAQTPRAWASGNCEVAIMWRWNGSPPSDLASERNLADGGAQVVNSCILWGSGGYQLVGSYHSVLPSPPKPTFIITTQTYQLPSLNDICPHPLTTPFLTSSGAEHGIAIYIYGLNSHFKTIMDQLIAGQLKCKDPSNPSGLCTRPYNPPAWDQAGPSNSNPNPPGFPSSRPPAPNKGTNKGKECSRGYGNGPSDCCEDRWYFWSVVKGSLAEVMLGAVSVLREGGVGWCDVVGTA